MPGVRRSKAPAKKAKQPQKQKGKAHLKLVHSVPDTAKRNPPAKAHPFAKFIHKSNGVRTVSPNQNHYQQPPRKRAV